MDLTQSRWIPQGADPKPFPQETILSPRSATRANHYPRLEVGPRGLRMGFGRADFYQG
jgi:hypothetical protein